jgi:hypothetical protein
MPKLKELQWQREGECIRCTSHKESNGNGYIKIYRNSRYATVPRLILEKRHGGISSGLVARHTCDNRWCINPDHILIGTYKNNAEDMVLRGRYKTVFIPGEKHPNAKLSVVDAKEIKSSTNKLRIDAEKYGVSLGTISDIRKGRTWNLNP